MSVLSFQSQHESNTTPVPVSGPAPATVLDEASIQDVAEVCFADTASQDFDSR